MIPASRLSYSLDTCTYSWAKDDLNVGKTYLSELGHVRLHENNISFVFDQLLV